MSSILQSPVRLSLLIALVAVLHFSDVQGQDLIPLVKPKPRQAVLEVLPAQDPPPPAPPVLPLIPADPFEQINREVFQRQQEMIRQMQQMQLRRLQLMDDPRFRRGRGFDRTSPDASSFREARLGARLEAPHPTLVDQLDLPGGQGLAVVEVVKDAPAEKIGLKTHDILLEFAGKAVPSDLAEFRKSLAEVPNDKPIDLVVLRKGRKETFKADKLPEPLPGDRAIGGDNERPNPNGLVLPELPMNPGFPNGGGGQFSVISTQNGTTFRLTGNVENGQPVITQATIVDGEKVVRANNIKEVPEEYRERVQQILRSLRFR